MPPFNPFFPAMRLKPATELSYPVHKRTGRALPRLNVLRVYAFRHAAVFSVESCFLSLRTGRKKLLSRECNSGEPSCVTCVLSAACCLNYEGAGGFRIKFSDFSEKTECLIVFTGKGHSMPLHLWDGGMRVVLFFRCIPRYAARWNRQALLPQKVATHSYTH